MLFEYLTTDVLLGKFFEPFVFENVPALNVTPDTVFLQEVENCDIYLLSDASQWVTGADFVIDGGVTLV